MPEAPPRRRMTHGHLGQDALAQCHEDLSKEQEQEHELVGQVNGALWPFNLSCPFVYPPVTLSLVFAPWPLHFPPWSPYLPWPHAGTYLLLALALAAADARLQRQYRGKHVVRLILQGARQG